MELLEEFLAGRHVATLATRNEDGSIQLSAVWFLYEDGAVHVATSPSTRKARNASSRPDGAILVDARVHAPLRGAAADGPLEVLHDSLELNERLWAKYLAPAGLRDPRVGGAIRGSDTATLRLTPRRWRTWSTGDDFGGAFEEPGLALPLDP